MFLLKGSLLLMLSFALWPNTSTAQEFTISEVRDYMKQSRAQLAISLKKKNFVKGSSEKETERYSNHEASVNIDCLFKDDKLRLFCWSEPIARQAKIIASLQTEHYTIFGTKKEFGTVTNYFKNSVTGKMIMMKIRPEPTKVSIWVAN